MSQHLVFLPCSIYRRDRGPCHLYGVVQTEPAGGASCYYVLNIESFRLLEEDQSFNNILTLVGDCHEAGDALILKLSTLGQPGHIEIRLINDSFQVHSLLLNGVKSDPSSVVIIVYDNEVFKHSELFLKDTDEPTNPNDHFKILASLIHKQAQDQVSLWWCSLHLLWTFLLFVANILLFVVSIAKPVFQYFALGSRLHGFLDSFIWAVSSLKRQNKVSLKVGNYILATAVDICTGILILHFIVYIGISFPLSDYLLKIAKEVVHSLQYLLQWLSGSPAGLKLNGPFNLMMGRFFMYHIKLWWVFLSVAQPVLEFLFTILLALGRLGVTFQAAILSDLLALVSFHIYCIYVYAARVYYLQLCGLRALWRLFLGRKHNPLRERVDSCQYSPDQLFVGTLAFTILLFLLPTTLMYYVVFTTMRLILLGLSGILTQACFIIHAMPIFSTVHWILGLNTVCNSVYIFPKSDLHNSSVVLYVTPVPDSWWNTVKCCLPETIVHPQRVQFGQLLHKLTVGELVYPV